MKKEQYLALVRRYLSALPPEDIERSLAFYQECIEDRMEDGMTEEEAVASLESPEAAARAILMDMPIPKLVKARARSAGKLSAPEIVLLVLGAPLWLPLLLAAGALVLSFFVVLWAIVLSLAAVVLALALTALGVTIGALFSVFKLGLPVALLFGGGALVIAGVAILLGFVVVGAARLTIRLFTAVVRGVKSLLIKKEEKA
ncbi:MAG: DUF1700 domain-containing protein [Oscillospiraceae bacterium]|nr:DUF1700 domain-containing protein [Oscillospiraceae bacterium]